MSASLIINCKINNIFLEVHAFETGARYVAV
jgi:hypothetical protein